MADDLAARAAVLEHAVSLALGIDLSQFDPEEAVAARAAALAAARDTAAAQLTAAVDAVVVELSTEERFARLERAVTQATGAKL